MGNINRDPNLRPSINICIHFRADHDEGVFSGREGLFVFFCFRPLFYTSTWLHTAHNVRAGTFCIFFRLSIPVETIVVSYDISGRGVCCRFAINETHTSLVTSLSAVSGENKFIILSIHVSSRVPSSCFCIFSKVRGFRSLTTIRGRWWKKHNFAILYVRRVILQTRRIIRIILPIGTSSFEVIFAPPPTFFTSNKPSGEILIEMIKYVWKSRRKSQKFVFQLRAHWFCNACKLNTIGHYSRRTCCYVCPCLVFLSSFLIIIL